MSENFASTPVRTLLKATSFLTDNLVLVYVDFNKKNNMEQMNEHLKDNVMSAAHLYLLLTYTGSKHGKQLYYNL